MPMEMSDMEQKQQEKSFSRKSSAKNLNGFCWSLDIKMWRIYLSIPFPI